MMNENVFGTFKIDNCLLCPHFTHAVMGSIRTQSLLPFLSYRQFIGYVYLFICSLVHLSH